MLDIFKDIEGMRHALIYFVPNGTNIKVLHKVRVCKRPQLTKEYKKLMHQLELGNLHGVGYTFELADLDVKQETKLHKVNGFCSMIKSLFTYNYSGISEGVVNPDDSYLKQYKKEFGSELFNLILKTYNKYLIDNFKVKHAVYTDGEGCTYNELTPISN